MNFQTESDILKSFMKISHVCHVPAVAQHGLHLNGLKNIYYDLFTYVRADRAHKASVYSTCYIQLYVLDRRYSDILNFASVSILSFVRSSKKQYSSINSRAQKEFRDKKKTLPVLVKGNDYLRKHKITFGNKQ